jgi:lysine/ornithine N-monooxygenase
MHDSPLLLSPMWVNQLPGHRFPLQRSFEKIPKTDFVRHLQSYARRYSMNWTGNALVKKVLKGSDAFTVETSKGIFKTRTVVNATGYYSSPYTPEFAVNDASIHMIHSAEYKSPTALEKLIGAGAKKILVVGKRVSAGQLLEELDDAGYSLGISIRAPIETRIGGMLGVIKENLYYVRERLRFSMDPYIKQNSLALMNGGKTDEIIRSERLRQHTTIDGIQKGEVFFSDGSRDEYDLIIFATGFKTAYPHLSELADDRIPLLQQLDMGRHKVSSGLFFIGVDNMINFKSRYVRGVASDSAIVAAQVRRHLNLSNE